MQMTKKLAGEAAGSAAWVTNVGNEPAQVLMSVLTACEGEGLVAMSKGLIRRYREAGIAPAQVLYVDRDCCAVNQRPKVPWHLTHTDTHTADCRCHLKQLTD